MYEYRCVITRVVDGDTVDVDIDLGFGVWLRDERVRLAGIDTPEKRTRDEYEKVFGNYATSYVETLLPVGTRATLLSKDFKGKFGRILGDFEVYNSQTDSWGSLVEMMINDRVGVRYEGQSKEDIAEAHKQNAEWLVNTGIVVL